MSNMTALDRIRMQIQWNRLLSVVEEQAQTLVRTAFSTSAREAGDISAGAFDTDGRMLAQAVTGTPGHVNAMAASVRSFLEKFPLETMEEGDVFLTNDPWLGTGHLNDFTAVTPTFHGGRIVALFASTTHVVDIGGRGFGPDGRQVYEEGLNIPILPLAKRGEFNSLVLEIVRANVRNPVEVEGDLYSLAACNEVGGRRLVDMMSEFELADLDDLARYVIDTSREGMLAEIRALPHGTYRNSMRIDGYERELDLVAAVTIDDSGMSVDFDGTSAVSTYGINVPITYTEAYASFGVRCVIGSRIPQQRGLARSGAGDRSGRDDPQRPAPLRGDRAPRHRPDAPRRRARVSRPDHPRPGAGRRDLVPLEPGPPRGARHDRGRPRRERRPRVRHEHLPHRGDGGTAREGRPRRDRLSVRSAEHPRRGERDHRPTRLLAQGVPRGLGGAGRVPGGTGQIMEVAHAGDSAFAINSMFDRVIHPPRGRNGGGSGETGRIYLKSGAAEFRGKGRQTIPRGDCLVLEMPGGGGLGDPLDRDAERVVSDVRNGLVSAERALADYGVVIGADERLDRERTETERQARRAAAAD